MRIKITAPKFKRRELNMKPGSVKDLQMEDPLCFGNFSILGTYLSCSGCPVQQDCIQKEMKDCDQACQDKIRKAVHESNVRAYKDDMNKAFDNAFKTMADEMIRDRIDFLSLDD